MTSKFKTRRRCSGKPERADEISTTDGGCPGAKDASAKLAQSQRKHLPVSTLAGRGSHTRQDAERGRTNLQGRCNPGHSLRAPESEMIREQPDTLPTAKKKSEKLRVAANTPNTSNTPLPRKVTIKAEHTVVLGNDSNVRISGLCDESGKRYVHVRQAGQIVVMPYEDWHGSGTAGSAALRAGGIVVVSGMGDIRTAVDKTKRFPPAKVVSTPGWSKHGFALPDGRVLVAADQPQPLVAFTPASDMLGQGGTLAGWIERVAGPLAEHGLASFLMMAMFAPPLLRFTNRADNIGLELSGVPGSGKSTFQFLMASAAGPAIGSEQHTYWRSLNTTINALEMILQYYNELPLILDEAGLVQGAGKAETRAATMRELAFRLSAGQVKHRFGEPAGPRSRLLYVISTNQPIASLLGSAHAAESEAIADRLITLPLLAERAHGIYDSCPLTFASTGAFAESLKQAAAQHYGHALPTFLSYLANEAFRRPEALRQTIDGHVANFMARSGTNTNDGSQLRVAQAVGLIYAGGRLAKQAGVLPRSYRCGKAALAALALHRSHARIATSFDDRLLALLRHSGTIDLEKVKISLLDEKIRGSCFAFLYTGRSGKRELLVPVKLINRVFPGWRALSHDPDVKQRLDRPEERAVRDRPVGPGGKLAPVYCFDVTDLAA